MNVLGTRTNINFLGKGKSPELMLDMDINPDALGSITTIKSSRRINKFCRICSFK